MEYACCHVWKSCDISHSCTASCRQIFIFHAFVWFPASRRHSISSAHNRRMPRPAFRYVGKYTDPIYTNYPSHVHTSGNGWFFSSVLDAPCSGMFLACEFTCNYRNLPPLLVVGLISRLVAKRLPLIQPQTTPLYHTAPRHNK